MKKYKFLILISLLFISGCMRLTTYEEKEQLLMDQKVSAENPGIVPLLKVK